jgi:hypothetical protein
MARNTQEEEEQAPMTTPAQAYGHPDFVNDWPVQGPTDPGIREADCRYAQTLPTPAEAPCVDCKGYVPMFARTKGLLGEQVSFGGRGVRAFALAAAGDPDVWTKLNPEQQKWVISSLTMLNNLIYQGTGTMCPTWGPSITAAGGCFQNWFNANAKLTKPDGSPVKLRTDGVFDQDTLDALNTITGMDPPHFPQAFPPGYITSAAPEPKKLSTGAMVGIAAAGAAALGGVVYVATRKRGRKSRRK